MIRLRYIVAILIGAIPTATVSATNITYTVDSSRSVLTASGTLSDISLQASVAGVGGSPLRFSGFVAPYFGTITANRDVAANTLQITGGNINSLNADLYQFIIDPDPANYDFFTAGSKTPFHGDIRNFSFSPVSPVVTTPTSFDTSQISASITSGEVDYLLFAENGTVQIDGTVTFATGNGSIIDDDGIETLTLPIDTHFTVLVNNLPLDINLSGTIFATASDAVLAPEPASSGLLIASLTCILLRKHR